MIKQTQSSRTSRQIRAICLKHGWRCQMERFPPNEIEGVDRRIVSDPRYRHNNAVMVAQPGSEIWQCLGWRWNVEMWTEEQIAAELDKCKAAKWTLQSYKE